MKRKINPPSTSQKKRKIQDEDKTSSIHPVYGNIFEGLTFYVHPANFGEGRLKLFEKQVQKFGGHLLEDLPHSSDEVYHIIFEESIDTERVEKLLDRLKFPNVVCLRCSWLSHCIKNKSRELTTDYEIALTRDVRRKSNNITDSNKVLSLSNIGETKAFTSPNTVSCVSGNGSPFNVGDESSESYKDVKSSNTSGTFSVIPCLQKLSETETEPGCSSSSTEFLKTNVENLKEDCQYRSNIQEEEVSPRNVNKDEEESVITTPASDAKTEEVPYRKSFPKNLQKKFVCSQPSSSQTKGFNSHITAELEKLAKAYKSKNDTWRALGYQKAISAIRNYPKEITTREEALSIRGVGARLADKVAEIVESGQLRKVAEVCDGEETKTLQLFMGVWGAGPSTAQSWYTQGFRTLDDLHTKATLTRHQQIGLKYYDDINSRIPRDEVVEIETYVREAALSIKKGLIVNVCGSYRRGKATCGDVDILITHPDGHSHNNLFKPILKRLRDTGFLTDDLVTQEDNGNQKKYLGVCILPGKDRKHRRLDIIVVPYAEFAPAIMYFTGSAHFNRSMRLLAVKMGMSLSEHGLRTGIVRQGREKLTDGRLLDTPTEESIFVHLGLEYRSPQERDH